MFTRSAYLKVPFIGAVFVGQRSERRQGQFLEHERTKRGELCLWVGPRFDVIWTPAAVLAAERAA